MKIEQLLVQYLYNNKKVSLQDIGSFTISPNVVVPTDSDRETVLPPDAIIFQFDRRAILDEGLVDFIVQQTRKIRPLASSDLESYSILSKQFLNIGKPLIIDGLGTLQKSQQGDYEFTQGQVVNARLEAVPSQMKEKLSEEISFKSTEKRSGEQPKKSGILITSLIVIILAGAALLYYYFNKKSETPVAAETPVTDTVVPPPVATTPLAMDTIVKSGTDSTSASAVPVNKEYIFKVVFKEYSTKLAAEKAFARYTSFGHKVILTPLDSTRYTLAIPFNTELSDTTRAKDSLGKFFQSKVYVDMN
jgi:hypothetical protein